MYGITNLKNLNIFNFYVVVMNLVTLTSELGSKAESSPDMSCIPIEVK